MNQLRRSLPAVWAALVAVLFQLSFAQAAVAVSGLSKVGLGPIHICGVMPDMDAAGGTGHQAPHHRNMDCMQCPLCAALVVHAALLPAVAALPPAPIAFDARRAPAPVLVAPVEPLAASFHPRGPPRLI